MGSTSNYFYTFSINLSQPPDLVPTNNPEEGKYDMAFKCFTVLINLVQSLGHLEGPHGVHVGGDDGNPSVAALGVPESEAPQQVHLERRTQQNFINMSCEHIIGERIRKYFSRHC